MNRIQNHVQKINRAGGSWWIQCDGRICNFSSRRRHSTFSVLSMHRVLAIRELLVIIFRMLWLEFSCNLNHALVCRGWSEIVLDILWENVSDLHRLFSLLAPLKANGTLYVRMLIRPLIDCHSQSPPGILSSSRL